MVGPGAYTGMHMSATTAPPNWPLAASALSLPPASLACNAGDMQHIQLISQAPVHRDKQEDGQSGGHSARQQPDGAGVGAHCREARRGRQAGSGPMGCKKAPCPAGWSTA
jgi:hypothetical protein